MADTKRARLVKDSDPLHIIMPFVMGTRTQNEALASFDLPCDNLDKYLAEKNSNLNPGEPKYTYLHALSAALCRVLEERPVMNRYFQRNRLWERKKISTAFMAKKQKIDGAEEALIVCNYDSKSEDSSIKQSHDKCCRQVKELRENSNMGDTDKLIRVLEHIPRFIFVPLVKFLLKLYDADKLPNAIYDSLPYSSSVFISNLGSIKLNANYHHLINHGSNSIFVILGSKYKKPEFHENNTFTLHDVLPISITLDERIADGIYFGNSIKMLQYLLLNPSLLDKPANEKLNLIDLTPEVFV